MFIYICYNAEMLEKSVYWISNHWMLEIHSRWQWSDSKLSITSNLASLFFGKDSFNFYIENLPLSRKRTCKNCMNKDIIVRFNISVDIWELQGWETWWGI